MEKHVHDWKRDSSTFEVKLVNLSIPPKKYLDYIKRQSLLIFVSCAPVGEFSVTCTCSHVQYANSALVTSKTDTTVLSAVLVKSIFFVKLIVFFSLCRVRYRLIIICSSMNTRLWVQTFLLSNKSTSSACSLLSIPLNKVNN